MSQPAAGSTFLRIVSSLLMGILAGAGWLAGQPLLVQQTSNAPAAISMRTFAGPAECKVDGVDPAQGITVALLLDTLSADDLDRVRADLTALYRALNGNHPVALAVLSGPDWQFGGPFRTQAQWRVNLEKFLKLPAAPVEVYSPIRLYDILAASSTHLGSGWSNVIFVGKSAPPDVELRDYVIAYLASRFRSQRLRVSYWGVDGQNLELWNAVAQSTGGVPVRSGLDDIIERLAGTPPFLLEVNCKDPPLDRGFVLYRAARLDAAGNAAGEIQALAMAPGTQAADVGHYSELRQAVRSAAALFKQPPTPDGLNQIRARLQAALAIDPADPGALRLGADFYKRNDDHKAAASLLAVLAQTDPLNAALLAELGHEQLANADLSGAEKSATRSRELRPGDARVAEDLARVQIARQNYQAALPLLDESLGADDKNAPLWFLRADVAEKLGDWTKTAESLERGLALSPDQLARTTALVQEYINHHAAERALPHVRRVVSALPSDAVVRTRYAEFLEELQKPDEALPVWRKVIEADPAMEKAYYRVARLLLDRGDFAGSVMAADAGIAVAPASGRLYLVKAEGLDKRGDFYQARRVLRAAASSIDDAALLLRLAEMEDASGPAPAHDYMRVAKVMQKSSPMPPEYMPVLRRGLAVSTRDGDGESAVWFSSQLTAAGLQTAATFTGARDRSTQNGVWVPGGLEALAFVARSNPKAPPERFFQDYCRAIRTAAGRPSHRAVEAYVDAIREHFRLVAALEALGVRDGHRVKIVLSLSDKASRERAEKVVNLLGWKMHANKKGVTLEAGEKAVQAKRQETASALAIDEVALEEALQESRPFTLEITDDWASLVVSEEMWRSTFYPKEQFAGGFAEAVVHDPRLARVYVGFTRLNRQASAAILSGIGLKRLAEKYAELFYEYSSSLAIENGRAAVPGGAAAEPIWQKLAGADPRNPGPFFQALLEKDDGKLLAFYSTISQLDADHQRFFTRNAARAGKFYDLLRETPEFASGIAGNLRTNSFIEFLRGVPLDTDGDVQFPGSPEVWMVAKGRSDSAKASRLTKKLAKVAAPDDEDEILLRLARTRYGASNVMASELDNFLAVARIDAHRAKPLDEASALLLAQWYSSARALYPYFAVLTGLEQRHFLQFFALVEKLRAIPEIEQNVVLGELHSLIQMVCLARESGRLSDRQAAALFGRLVDHFLTSASQADFAASSLDLARELIRTSGGDATQSADDAMRDLLVGHPAPVIFEFGGVMHEINPVQARRAEYQQVLELQKVPSLSPLFAMSEAAASLAAGKGNPSGHVRALEGAVSSLQEVAAAKKTKMSEAEHNLLARFQPKNVHNTIAHIRQQVEKKKPDPKEIQKLCQDLMTQVNPQLELALSGIIYAYYLRPSDLLIAEDPLLLRKHEFRSLDRLRKQELFAESDLNLSSEGTGSHFEGGFAGFSNVVGRVAAANAKSDPNAQAVLSHQLGTLRATAWNRLYDRDVRLAGLKFRLAREWILASATVPEARAGLAAASLGLLSRARRADLLNGIDSRNWSIVWSAVTLSDLYFLADRYLASNQADLWQSPVIAGVRHELTRSTVSHLDQLGASLPDLFDCDHSHLVFLAPYEEYERYMLPNKLAERTSEFKFYLANFADQAGLPAAALGQIAEVLARQLLGAASMSDLRDWAAVPSALARLNESMVKEVLDKS